ncbi:hypothetical protein ACRAWF_24010, partial [Streptomyces sp. L7]
ITAGTRPELLPGRRQGPLLPRPRRQPRHRLRPLTISRRRHLPAVSPRQYCMSRRSPDFVRKVHRHAPCHGPPLQDPDTAQLMGIDANRIIVIAFAIGGNFFAAGSRGRHLLRPRVHGNIDYRMGLPDGPQGTSPRRSWAASATSTAPCSAEVVLGVAETRLASAYISKIPGMEQLGGSELGPASWAFCLLILVLLFRPQGLLGERVADRA